MPTAPTVHALGKPQTEVGLPSQGELVGRYVVLEPLGAGAMGTVLLASDVQLQRRVALKLLTHDVRGNRLLDEARALARVQHPNVVLVHDIGRWRDQLYMVMEYIDGVSLSSWLVTHTDWRERLAVFVQAALGLAAAHRAGIVHHDIKPSNVMVGDDGRVRLVDFGLAHTPSPDSIVGSPGGTPRYMSPEQRRGEQADARTDQFSLCVALYEALFGEYPFPGTTSDERGEAVLAGRVRVPPPGEIPVEIRDAIVKGLASNPEERHDSIDALLAALVPSAYGMPQGICWQGGALQISRSSTH